MSELSMRKIRRKVELLIEDKYLQDQKEDDDICYWVHCESANPEDAKPNSWTIEFPDKDLKLEYDISRFRFLVKKIFEAKSLNADILRFKLSSGIEIVVEKKGSIEEQIMQQITITL